VPTRAGLAVVFPNIYQYRRTPFRLKNPTEEGHQTLVAFFLIDPEIQPIISTSKVAPQQNEWIRRAVDESADVRLPAELIEKIVEGVEGLMTQDEAEGYRTEMLKERVDFWKTIDYHHFCIPFDTWDVPEFPH